MEKPITLTALVSQRIGKCVNDVTYFWNYVTVLSLRDCIFASELLFVTNKIYGITTGSVFITYKISNS
jgi:hypothetical protein